MEGEEMREVVVGTSFPSVYKGTFILPRPSSKNNNDIIGGPNWAFHHHHHHHQQQAHHGMTFFYKPPPSSSSSSSSSCSERTASALRVHSENEKRRRDRINAHLSTLRRMLPPHALKLDKASLLSMVIEQVKELNKKTMDINKSFEIPSATNEVTVETKCNNEASMSDGDGVLFIKASVCCDDRPDLFTDLMNAFQGLRLRTVRADLMSLGGRAHNVFILCKKDDHENDCLKSLMESLRQVLTSVVSSNVVSSTKRQIKVNPI